MTTEDTLSKYNVAIVEAVLLEEAVELHPRSLPDRELWLRIVGDANDAREVETANQAICNLRESGLFADREDKIVEPTPAALRAVALLT
jgi:hypothetical protein